MVLRRRTVEALHDVVHYHDGSARMVNIDEETSPNLMTKLASTLEIEFQLLFDDELSDLQSCLRVL